MDHLNLFKSMLDSCKYVYPPATFQLITLKLDTGASFVLTSFKSELVDNLQCDIPIKYISKVNKVIGIGTTIHKL